jgi:hypothetical protein
VGLAVTTMPLLPVSDNLEATDDLTNAEETKNLSGDDTGAPVLCARCAADLREDGVGVHAVGQLAGVAEGVERGLEVALHGLDGAVVYVRNAKWQWRDVGMGLRRSHAALLDDQLADLETNAAVVCDLGDKSWRAWLAGVRSVAIHSLCGEESMY